MRTVFFGRGPGIKAGHQIDWIKLVDEYQAWTMDLVY